MYIFLKTGEAIDCLSLFNLILPCFRFETVDFFFLQVFSIATIKKSSRNKQNECRHETIEFDWNIRLETKSCRILPLTCVTKYDTT